MEKESVLYFMLGFLVCAFLFFSYYGLNNEVPLGTGNVIGEVVSPPDFIDSEDILVFEDMLILRISNVSISNYAPTGSMIPLFDKGSNGIRIVPKNEGEINVGDIVSFEKDGLLIVHRVIEKDIDEEGVYFITKGDNNFSDDGKIRFSQIRYKTIGVLW